jgi:hypothetical protein
MSLFRESLERLNNEVRVAGAPSHSVSLRRNNRFHAREI